MSYIRNSFFGFIYLGLGFLSLNQSLAALDSISSLEMVKEAVDALGPFLYSTFPFFIDTELWIDPSFKFMQLRNYYPAGMSAVQLENDVRITGECATLSNYLFFHLTKLYPQWRVFRAEGYEPLFFNKAPMNHSFLLITTSPIALPARTLKRSRNENELEEYLNLNKDQFILVDPSFDLVIPFKDAARYWVRQLAGPENTLKYNLHMNMGKEGSLPVFYDGEFLYSINFWLREDRLEITYERMDLEGHATCIDEFYETEGMKKMRDFIKSRVKLAPIDVRPKASDYVSVSLSLENDSSNR